MNKPTLHQPGAVIKFHGEPTIICNIEEKSYGTVYQVYDLDENSAFSINPDTYSELATADKISKTSLVKQVIKFFGANKGVDKAVEFGILQLN